MSKRLLDHLAAAFSKIRPGEGIAVVILLVDLFLMLTAYYLLKVVREPLILLDGGPAVKSYSAAGQAALLVVLVPAYGALASRVPRMVLVNLVMGLFIATFVGFWVLLQADAPIGVPFYLWLGIFNMLVVAQFWSLANELFSPAQGKRLFPIIAFGGTLGAIVGAWVASELVGALGIGPLLLLASGLLGGCIVLTLVGARAARRAPRGEDEPDETTAPRLDQARPLRETGGFQLVRTVRYLRLIALMIIAYNVVNTLGEYILSRIVTETAKAAAEGNRELATRMIGEFYGNFFTWVNAIAAVLQAFVVSRVIRYLGVRVALVILPAIALGGYTLLAVAPVLGLIKVAKIAENSVDYSLHNTVRQTLWLPTSTEAKYKAKAAVDTFFVRFGDVLAAGIVGIGSLLALAPRMFAVVNVAIVLVWSVLAFLVGREHDRQPEIARRAPVAEPVGPILIGGKYGRATA
ncbi:MAG: NTP/NDP exchange transporter [Kofleriaceae bacterium]